MNRSTLESHTFAPLGRLHQAKPRGWFKIKFTNIRDRDTRGRVAVRLKGLSNLQAAFSYERSVIRRRARLSRAQFHGPSALRLLRRRRKTRQKDGAGNGKHEHR